MKLPRAFLVFCLLLAAGAGARASDQFGDIMVDASAIYTGNTYHGYAERRVLLANESHDKTHLVTLIYPNDTYGNMGNSIGRVSRTVTLAPDAREVVSLLQPPLPAQGDSLIRVEVDNRHEGQVHAPNPNAHCNMNYYWRGSPEAGTVFISRSLNFDSVEHVFKANRGAYTAAMAVGPPDAVGGRWQNTWMPDTRAIGAANWLELDYATPQPVNRVVVHHLNSSSFTSAAASPSIELIGTAGTNIATLAAPASHGRGGGPAFGTLTYSCPVTSQPVAKVRLDFGTAPPSSLAIDAVEISGPSGSQWASDARASSDNSASAGRYGGAVGDQVDSLRAESPVTEWSDNWLAYTPFDCIVLNAADVRSMPAAVQGALGDYLAAGGAIVLSGQTELPATWHSWGKEEMGAGMNYRIGFGRCLVLASEDFSDLGSSAIRQLREEVRSDSHYWQALPADAASANSVLPVVATLKIPTRGIVIIMLAFIIAIGPVNIICLNRCKRRTWMLWTIPAISMATTLVVFVYSLLREGITPDTHIAGLTLIDQSSHHAATIGGTAFYCPLTPSGGLHFEFGTEVTPLVERGYNAGSAREVDWSQSQQFRRGWVSSRVPAYFHLRKSETRRERIQVLLEGGQWQIVNGLGAPVKELWLAWNDGKIYKAENVAAGDKAALTPSGLPAPAEKPGLDGLLRQVGFGGQPDYLKADAGKYLSPNTYIAVLDGNPFIENGLGSAASAKRTKSSAIVFGFLEPAVK